ncbi:MAG: hypothetical protein RR920_08560 [Lachnospiraceae bacterium]
MQDSKEYEIIKLIDHGSICHISLDCVKGKSLMLWLQEHPYLEKRQLFDWIQGISRQLEQFHRGKTKPCYQYVNPYSLLVTEAETLAFLAMNAPSNEILKKTMNRRSIRLCFCPPSQVNYIKPSVANDIYGLGKTIQFLLFKSEVDPPLTKREEYTYQKIIYKCLRQDSKYNYQNVKEILKEYPKFKEQKHNKKKKFFILGALCLLIGVFILGRFRFKEQHSINNPIKETTKELSVEQKKVEKQVQLKEVESLKMQLGFLYFLKLEDYIKSKTYFQQIALSNTIAEYYVQVLDYLIQPQGKSEEAMLLLLKKIESDAPTKERLIHYHSLVKVYASIDSAKAKEELIRVAESYIGSPYRKESEMNQVAEPEIRYYLAMAYEEKGDTDKAITQYELLQSLENSKESKESIYLHLVKLYEEEQVMDQAWEHCKEGIKEYPHSIELKLQYVRMQCRTATVERSVCAETLKQYIKESPELQEHSEFKKLQQEYNIQVEGEEVWVGK